MGIFMSGSNYQVWRIDEHGEKLSRGHLATFATKEECYRYIQGMYP